MPSATARTTTGILIASLAISSFSGIAGAAIDPGSSTRQTDFDDPSTWPKESEYSGNIQQCLDTPENERATIRSFICPSGNAAGNLLDTSYQVAIDSAFRKIDKESESFIKTLKDSGGSKITDVNLAIRGKFAEGGELQKQYMALCQSRALREGISHFGAVSTE
ncbi:MAG TPA: hypothetical protein PK765_05735 [bacterium]|nr:hypothetical protein [bacterium]